MGGKEADTAKGLARLQLVFLAAGRQFINDLLVTILRLFGIGALALSIRALAVIYDFFSSALKAQGFPVSLNYLENRSATRGIQEGAEIKKF